MTCDTSKKVLSAIVGAAMVMLTASHAAAAPISLDFTSSPYGSINGQQNASVTDHGLTLSFGTVNFSTLSQGGNGIGVASISGDDGEIGCGLAVIGCWSLERLDLGLSAPVTLYSIAIRRFFPNEFFTVDEQGTYRINGGAPVAFTASNTSGLYTLDFGPAGISGVNSLSFSTPGGLLSDYTVAGLSIEDPAPTPSRVPEPTMTALLGCALLGVARARKRLARN